MEQTVGQMEITSVDEHNPSSHIACIIGDSTIDKEALFVVAEMGNTEKWMKDTAGRCMVLATLFATIAFALVLRVPGRYDQNTDKPLLYAKPAFRVFVVAGVISFLSASASALMFLSILTSRLAQHDFLDSLPKRLISGLATLCLSITTMMIAFSVNFVVYKKELIWAPILINTLVVVPVLPYVASWYYKLLN